MAGLSSIEILVDALEEYTMEFKNNTPRKMKMNKNINRSFFDENTKKRPSIKIPPKIFCYKR
jgi:hypothetical protein